MDKKNNISKSILNLTFLLYRHEIVIRTEFGFKWNFYEQYYCISIFVRKYKISEKFNVFQLDSV